MEGDTDIIRYGNDKRTCCVPHCPSHGNFYKDGKKIGYFTFPIKEPEKTVWMERCNVALIKNFKPRASFVCTEHFYEDEIEYFPFSKKWRRKPGVMPSRFECWANTPVSPDIPRRPDRPPHAASTTLAAETRGTDNKLDLPELCSSSPDPILPNVDQDVPSNILKDDPDDLSNAPLDLEAIIEDQPLAIKEDIELVKRHEPTKEVHINEEKPPSSSVLKSSEKKGADQVNQSEKGEPGDLAQKSQTAAAQIETDSDSYDGFSDSEDSDEDDLQWVGTESSVGDSAISAQSDSQNTSSSAIDINAILASAHNASSILSAAINTSNTNTVDDMTQKIQKRILKATCINCNAMFLDPTDLKKHILTHKKTLYACEVCNEKFPTVFLLKKHSRVHEMTSSDSSCNLVNECSKPASSYGNQVGNHRNQKRKREEDGEINKQV